jgi:phage FluMu protein Com
MQLRCYRCGWSFGIKKEEIAFAIEALEESGGVHYDIRCPRCRHANKISLEQLKRSAPQVEEEAEEMEAEEMEGEEPEESSE